MPFLLLLLLIFSTPAAADFESGRKAFAQGDFERAFTEWQAAAEQGDASAQRNVGHLYRWGKGVPQDLTQAAYWYFTAAKNGSAGAQYNLGVMYLRGEGVPRNEEEGTLWLERSAEQGYAKAKKRLQDLKADWDDFPADEEILSPVKQPVNPRKETKRKEPPLYAHLASYYTQETLDMGWKELKQTYPELKAFKTVETQVSLPEKGKYIRLYIKGKPADVKRVCGLLNDKKQYCLISYP